MPIFRCSKCGRIENTALSNYWTRSGEPLCSECDPEIGKWHGVFNKMPAKGFYLGNDGFLYSEKELEGLKWREQTQEFKIIGRIE